MTSKEGVRFGQARALTIVTAAFIVTLVATMGTTAVLLSAITLPLPLVLLWLSADVVRSDEREPDPRTRRTEPPVGRRDAPHEEAELRKSA